MRKFDDSVLGVTRTTQLPAQGTVLLFPGVVMGYSAGGHLATRLVQGLPEKQQPDDVVLVCPAFLEEMAADAMTPAVQPPARPRSRLVAIMAADDRATRLKGCRDYVDAWRKAGNPHFPARRSGHRLFQRPWPLRSAPNPAVSFPNFSSLPVPSDEIQTFSMSRGLGWFHRPITSVQGKAPCIVLR